MTDQFHPDFYVTCATVIPVLFLVVAVRAGKYESELVRQPKKGGTRLLLSIAYASVVVGGVGEFGALLELLLRQDNPWWRGIALAATLLLLGVVLFSPFLGLLRATRGALRDSPPSTTEAGADA